MSNKNDDTVQAELHNARGIELAERGWLDEAIKEFQRATELAPQSAHAFDNLGTVYADKGQLWLALQQFTRAVEAEPTSPNAHYYLASFLASQGNELAIQRYRHALELDPEFEDAHLNLGLALADLGRLEECLAQLQTAHALAPEDELIEHELACCLIDLERYPKAIQILKKIIKNNDHHVEAYVDLGIAYTAQGFYEQAEQAFKGALKVDPHDFNANYHIAALFAVWDKTDACFEKLHQAATLDRERVKNWLRDDHIFENLRDDVRFQKLCET